MTSPTDSSHILHISQFQEQAETLHIQPCYQQSFFDGNPHLHPEISSNTLGVTGELNPYQLKKDDAITSIVLLLFLLLLVALSQGRKFLAQQTKALFYPPRNYNSLFSEETGLEKHSLIFLKGATIITFSLLFFSMNQESLNHTINPQAPYILWAINLAVCLVYFLFKGIAYNFINWIFFDKEDIKKWKESYNFLYVAEGFFAFPLLLLTVYFELSTHNAIIYLTLVIISMKIMLFYKCLVIFFSKIHGFLHLIVYFCALEIIPLLLLFGGLTFINNNFTIKI